MNEDQPKHPTTDERLEALTHNLELAKLEREHMRREQLRLDARERRGRLAVIAAMQAYIETLQEPPDEQPEYPEDPT